MDWSLVWDKFLLFLNSYFSIPYMILLFTTSYAFIKKTNLRKLLSTGQKQWFVVVLGVVYGIGFVWFDTVKTGSFMDGLEYAVKIGCSWGATVLFHDYIWNWKEAVERFIEWKNKRMGNTKQS